MNKKIDIIIPMYNRSRCIDNLLNSLKIQTMQDFRVIFVDDGSTDDTQSVLRDRLKEVPFPYMVFFQENRGAGAARNTGLRHSDAEWSVFVDSDDTLTPEYLQYLYTAATQTKADFAYCDFEMVEEGTEYCVPAAGALDVEIITASKCMKLHYTSWLSNACLIINGDFRRKHQIFYDEDCTYTEDNNFVTDLICAAETIAKVNNKLYLYHIYKGSRSRSPNVEKFISGVRSFQRMEKKLECADTSAAETFRAIAPTRYYLATYRKAAVQLPYSDFKRLSKEVPFENCRDKIRYLPIKQRIAGEVLLISKPIFYVLIRMMFKD